jgi:aryl-alcohol dehydrogenase-like predicted oxidoreductase
MAHIIMLLEWQSLIKPLDNMKLILGTVQMGLDYGINNKIGKIPKKQVFEILEFAYQNNIRTLDTAAAYGNAHSIIGEYHKLYPEKKFKIITKLPKDISLNVIENTIEQYLRELSIDFIDVIMFHDFDTYEKNYSPKLFNKLKSERKIGKVGVSVYTNSQIITLTNDINIDLIQLPFNLLDNLNLRGEVLKKAHLEKKEIHTRSAFLQGLFFLDSNYNKIYLALENYIASLKIIAQEEGVSLQKLALGYSYQNEFSNGVIIGIDSLDHLKQNIDLVSDRISKAALEKINKIQVTDTNLLNPSKWT